MCCGKVSHLVCNTHIKAEGDDQEKGDMEIKSNCDDITMERADDIKVGVKAGDVQSEIEDGEGDDIKVQVKDEDAKTEVHDIKNERKEEHAKDEIKMQVKEEDDIVIQGFVK